MSDPVFDESKIFLQHAGPSGVSVYDHLSNLVAEIIKQKPEDPLAIIEQFSKELKLSSFVQKPSEETMLDEKPAFNALDQIHMKEYLHAKSLLAPVRPRKGAAAQPKVQFDNALEEAYYFRRFGVGLAEEEYHLIILHMQKFFANMPMKSVRFFGKIFGLEHNYYVVETEPAVPLEPLDDPIVAKSIPPPPPPNAAGAPGGAAPAAAPSGGAAAPPAQPAPPPEGAAAADGEAPTPLSTDKDEPVIPPPKLDPPPEVVPLEEAKEGTPNQYVYWMIRQARLLTKTLTGCLDAPVSAGYPSFDGTERHLLRAQLARIAASARVVPRAMVKRRRAGGEEEEGGGQEEEEAEEEDDGTPTVSGTLKAGAVVSVAGLGEDKAWLHARPPLLVQGRAEKWPPKKKRGGEGGAEEGEEGGEEEEEEEGEEMEEEEEEGGSNPEAGKRLLKKPDIWEGTDEKGFGRDLRIKRSITEDKKLLNGAIPSFVLRKDSTFEATPIVLLKSMYWPGYYTVAYGGKKAKIASIYIGYAKKYTALPFTIPPPPMIPDEHPDLDELIDPTVDQETQAISGKEEAPPARDREEEEEEEGEEEEDY